MASSNQSQHACSVARWNSLMAHRELIVTNKSDPRGIDRDIAKAFDPHAAAAIDGRLSRVTELCSMSEEMAQIDLDGTGLYHVIATIFFIQSSSTLKDDVARWKDLMKIRGQMAILSIDTSDIDKRIQDIFEPPAITQPSSHCPITPSPRTSSLPLRKRVASTNLESPFKIRKQAGAEFGPDVNTQNTKLDFWAAGNDSNWAVSVTSICMSDAFYHVGSEHLASLQPDIKTQTIQVYRSQPQAYGVNACHSWVSVTRIHSALFFSPNTIRCVFRAPGSAKARLVLNKKEADEIIVDVTFLEPVGVIELLSKLRKLDNVCIEETDSKHMNEIFANYRLRKEKILI